MEEGVGAGTGEREREVATQTGRAAFAARPANRLKDDDSGRAGSASVGFSRRAFKASQLSLRSSRAIQLIDERA